MNKLKYLILLVNMLLLSTFATAQTTIAQQTDIMRSNGKLYVVVAVVLVILIALFIYAFIIDKKISRLEKK